MKFRSFLNFPPSLLPCAAIAAALSTGPSALGSQTLVATAIASQSGGASVFPQPSILAVLAIGGVYLLCYNRWTGSKRLPRFGQTRI